MNTILLLVTLMFFYTGYLFANPLDALSIPTISLSREYLAAQEPIGKYMAVASDREATLTPTGILSGTGDELFRTTDGQRTMGFGANRPWPHWAVFAVDSSHSSTHKILLESAYVAIDRISLYHFDQNGEQIASESLGDQLPFSKRKIQYRYPVFALQLEPGLNYIVLKVETSSIVVFDLTLYEEQSFQNAKMQELTAVGILLGGVFIILSYNLFLYLSTKDLSYGLYVIYVASFFFYALSYYGVAPFFVFSDWEQPPLTGWGLYVLIDIITIGACLFTSKFLNLRSQAPWYYRSVIFFFVAAVANIVVALLGQGELSQTKTITLLLSFLMGPTLVAAGIYRAVRGFGPAIYFVIAWFFVISGNTLVLLANSGLIEKTFLSSWSQLIGANLEMVFLSFALGARINLIKAEKLEAEKIAREANAKALAEERRLNEQRDQLVANTSHELRTPLNGIMGLIQAIIKRESASLSEDTHQSLNGVIASCKRLSALIGDLLDFSRGQHKKVSLYRGSLQLRQQVEIVVEQLKPTIEGRPVDFQVIIPTTLPMVDADPDRLQQILFNLIGNACKFTEKGHIEIAAKQAENRIVVSIEDTGPGIAEDAQGKVFEAFSQADGGISRQYGGSGLGLAIVKQLVEAHGGEIGLQSQIGFGSVFWFSLPLASDDQPEYQTEKSALLDDRIVSLKTQIEASSPHAPIQVLETQNEAAGSDTAQLNLLVVDDEPLNRQVLNELLTLNGHRVQLASDGVEAMRLIEQNVIPDIVLLDVMLPGISGYDVLASLRERYNEAELPVILLTAKALEKDLVQGFRLGASDYIRKPFVSAEVEARIAHQARLKKAIWDSQSAREESHRTRHRLEKTEDQLLHAERLASIGAATAGIAHDLRNPLHHVRTTLGWIRTRASQLQALPEAEPEPIQTEVAAILETTEIAEKASNTALELAEVIRVAARSDEGAIELLPVASIVDDVLALLHHKLKHLTVDCQVDTQLAVRGKRSELIQLIMNLIGNAADATSSSEHKQVNIQAKALEHKVLISVEDSGPGIPDNLRQVIFDPFYTTKESGKGTGLGLAVVRTVIKHQGGELEVGKSRLLGGAEFRISLPAA